MPGRTRELISLGNDKRPEGRLGFVNRGSTGTYGELNAEGKDIHRKRKGLG